MALTQRTFKLFPRFFPLLIGLFPLFGAPAAFAQPEFARADGKTLVFKDEGGKEIRLEADAENLGFIGFIGGSESPFYAFYSGKKCSNCQDDQTYLFAQRLDGKLKPYKFLYPGKITEPKKGVVYEARGFYGHCLPNLKSGFVVYQKEAVGGKRRTRVQRSVYVARPGPLKIEEDLIDRRMPNVNTTLQLVKRKSCFEVAGSTRSILRKPFDISLRRDEDDDEDEDDAKPGETSAPPEGAAATP